MIRFYDGHVRAIKSTADQCSASGVKMSFCFLGNITVPKLISNKMLQSDRIHIEVDLEDRIRFILKVRMELR